MSYAQGPSVDEADATERARKLAVGVTGRKTQVDAVHDLAKLVAARAALKQVDPSQQQRRRASIFGGEATVAEDVDQATKRMEQIVTVDLKAEPTKVAAIIEGVEQQVNGASTTEAVKDRLPAVFETLGKAHLQFEHLDSMLHLLEKDRPKISPTSGVEKPTKGGFFSRFRTKESSGSTELGSKSSKDFEEHDDGTFEVKMPGRESSVDETEGDKRKGPRG